MADRLNLFIGWDSREPIAFSVLAHSILSRASCPVSITPLVQPALRTAGLYWRERNPLESTAFSFTRFLVPALCGYKGTAVFCDSDMLCRVDIAELYAWVAIYFQEQYQPPDATEEAYDIGGVTLLRQKPGRFTRSKALLCCQHDYKPKEDTKFLGNVQTTYERKNWSSFMVFQNEECKALTPQYVNTASGLELHRFRWLRDDQIGALPLEWNYLVNTPNQSSAPPKVVHYTDGGPYFPEYADCEYASEWFEERDAMMGVRVAA